MPIRRVDGEPPERLHRISGTPLQDLVHCCCGHAQVGKKAGYSRPDGFRRDRLVPAAAADDVVWKADRGALFTLLKNLLENVIQHAPAGTAVSVDIQSDMVTVRDCGPGVDAAQLPLLFERFWRGAHRRDHGAGLGLAICQEIALTHGWRLTAERAEPGLRFRLAIEAARQTRP